MTSEPPARGPRRLRTAALAASGIALVALLVGSLLRARGDGEDARDERGPAPKPRVAVENGEVVVRLSPAERERSGIAAAPVGASDRREDVRAHARVMDLAPLAELHNAYAVAAAQTRRAAAAVEAARHEHERVEVLHRDDRNMSARALEQAAAALRAAEAEEVAARAPLETLAVTARQDWGPAVTRWLVEDAPALARLLEGRSVLVQVTVTSDQATSTATAVASLETGGRRVTARLLSTAGRADPRVQGASAFYLAPRDPGLLPGATLAAFLPAGPTRPAAVVPDSAVVRWQGKGWVYEETAPGRFVRRELKTDAPAREGGYFVRDFPAGASVVVRGAQMLLSEELRAHIEMGAE
jgi:hypothetical protein